MQDVLYDLSLVKKKDIEAHLENAILYLILQPNVGVIDYQFIFNCVEAYTGMSGDKRLCKLLGDLLDPNIYGLRDFQSFERRVNLYLQSGDVNRIVAVLLTLHQKLEDSELRVELEDKMIDLFKQKKTYSAGDFKLLSQFSFLGTGRLFSTGFKHFVFPALQDSKAVMTRPLGPDHEATAGVLQRHRRPILPFREPPKQGPQVSNETDLDQGFHPKEQV